MTVEEVKSAIIEGLGDVDVSVEDSRGTGDYFRVEIRGDCFAGKSLIEQHRMVKNCLHSELDSGKIHALSIKTTAN